MSETEREERKRAIFEGMSRRGKERVLRMGYEAWDPFQEPKDPREQMFSGPAAEARMAVEEFSRVTTLPEALADHRRELFEFARDLASGREKARLIAAFARWWKEKE